MDQIPWDHIGIGSGWAIVCLGVIGIFRGWLVPKPFYDRQVHEANEWHTEGRIKDQQIAELQEQNRHVREVGKTVNAIMRSIGHNARSTDRVSREEDT
jgi:hypothetical protein